MSELVETLVGIAAREQPKVEPTRRDAILTLQRAKQAEVQHSARYDLLMFWMPRIIQARSNRVTNYWHGGRHDTEYRNELAKLLGNSFTVQVKYGVWSHTVVEWK